MMKVRTQVTKAKVRARLLNSPGAGAVVGYVGIVGTLNLRDEVEQIHDMVVVSL